MKLGVTTKKQKLARIFVKDSMLTLLTFLLNLFFKGGDNRYLTNLVERGKTMFLTINLYLCPFQLDMIKLSSF